MESSSQLSSQATGKSSEFSRSYTILGISLTIVTDSHHFLECFDCAYSRYALDSRPRQSHEIYFKSIDNCYLASNSGRTERFPFHESWPAPTTFVELLLERELRDYLFVHASSVEVGGLAYLFAGPSTSGKTTLALSLAQRGAHLMSEDRTPVSFTRGKAVPFPTRVNLREATRVMATEQRWNESFGFEASTPAGSHQEFPIGGLFFVVPDESSAIKVKHDLRKPLEEYGRMRAVLGLSGSKLDEARPTRLLVNGPLSFHREPTLEPCSAAFSLKRISAFSSCGGQSVGNRIREMGAFLDSVPTWILRPGHILETSKLVLDVIGIEVATGRRQRRILG